MSKGNTRISQLSASEKRFDADSFIRSACECGPPLPPHPGVGLSGRGPRSRAPDTSLKLAGFVLSCHKETSSGVLHISAEELGRDSERAI